MNKEVLLTLSEGRSRLIAIRSSGFNHVDLATAKEFGIKVVREGSRVFTLQRCRLGGSLPLGIHMDYVKLMIKEVKKRMAYCYIDRPGKFLKDIIYLKPDFIKPNLVEFQSLLGKKVTTIKTILPIGQKLLEYIPLFCLSSIEGGALLLGKDKIWFGKIPKVKIQSTVGAVDSKVGARASLRNKNPHAIGDELLRMGPAAFCATLAEHGLTLGSKKSIIFYHPKIKIKEIT